MGQLPGKPPQGVTALPPTLSLSLGPKDQSGPSELPQVLPVVPSGSFAELPRGHSGTRPSPAPSLATTRVKPQPPVQGRQRRCSISLPQPAFLPFQTTPPPRPTGPPLQAPVLRDAWSSLFSFPHVPRGLLLTSAPASGESGLSSQTGALWWPLFPSPQAQSCSRGGRVPLGLSEVLAPVEYLHSSL